MYPMYYISRKIIRKNTLEYIEMHKY